MRRSWGGALLVGAVVGSSVLGGAVWGQRTVEANQVGQPKAARSCPVTYDDLESKLQEAEKADATGLDNDYWAVVVDREGVVCAVAHSGEERDSQWLLSRQIAAAKAFTANGLSLDGSPLSTAQLYALVQPGAPFNPLFGLAAGNPVDTEAAYAGPYNLYGTANDPMVGRRVGGTITFGGGLGLFAGTNAVGGLGLSGDTACADHSTAWRLRILLDLQPTNPNDTITLNDPNDAFSHPDCPNDNGTQGVTPLQN